MNNNRVTSLIGFAFLMFTITVNAGVVRFTDPVYNVASGASISLNLIGENFVLGPDGAGFSLQWDPTVLSYTGSTFADPPWDIAVPGEANVATGSLDSVFLGVSVGDAGTDFDIGSFQFDVIGADGTSTALQLADVFGGWASPGGLPIVVNYSASNVTIVTPIPLPGALWMMGSGLVGLLGFVRHKKIIT